MLGLAENLTFPPEFADEPSSANASLTLDERQSRQAAIEHCTRVFRSLTTE